VVVADVKGRVRFDETDGGMHGGADAPALSDDVVLEPAGDPETGCFLDEDEGQPPFHRFYALDAVGRAIVSSGMRAHFGHTA
jgi:hypothetical protein